MHSTIQATTERRRERYRRRGALGRIAYARRRAGAEWVDIPFARQGLCERRLIDGDAQAELRCVHGDDGPRAYTAGTRKCGSVWLCPVCSAKIRSRRSLEVAAIAAAHSGAGLRMSMLTLTLRHRRQQSLSELLEGLCDSWRSLIQSAAWRTVRANLVGMVRAIEVTRSDENGWHPHLHVLLLWDEGGPVGLDHLREPWAERVDRRLGLRPNGHGLDHRELDAGAAEYVTKIAAEMSRADLKGGRSFWHLIDAADDGEAGAMRLCEEYATAMKGRRAIQFSRGLRERYAVDVLSDEEIAALDVEGALVRTLTKDELWKLTRPQYGRAPLLVDEFEQIELDAGQRLVVVQAAETLVDSLPGNT